MRAAARELLIQLPWLVVAYLAIGSGMFANGQWYDFNPSGSVSGQGILKEVLTRTSKPPGYYEGKYSGDLATMCHEATHSVNERMSNEAGMNREAFYVGGGKACIIDSPRITLAAVRDRVPQQYRGWYYNAYLINHLNREPVLNTLPTFVLDEWSAAINGMQAAKELNVSDTGDSKHAKEFCHVADALVATVQQLDPSYPQMNYLVEFVEHQKARVASLTSGQQQPYQPRTQTYLEPMNRIGLGQAPNSAKPMQCASGQCYGGSWQPYCGPIPQTNRVVIAPTPANPQVKPPIPASYTDPRWTEWRNKIEAQIAAIKPCQCDQKQQVTKQDLEEALAKIALKPGPQGPAGPQGPPGPAGQTGSPATVPNKEQHIVIVADRNSSWWPRLAEDIEKTKDTYVGIRVAPVPDNYAGEIPTAVVYEDSVAVRVVPGERNVLDLLSRVRRGMSI